MHHLVQMQEKGFAWEDSERGHFREDFFPPVDIPGIPHMPWVEHNIPIPPGLYDEVCQVIKTKIDAGVYEPSNSSYRSHWFCIVKKDGKSLHLVHSLEPLNKVTIQHSGAPPFTDQLAEGFARCTCGAVLDLYVGYYRSRWFCVVKKDGKSLCLVHSLEPLNKVTIQHSGAPPFTDQLAEGFARRTCGAVLDLYVGVGDSPLLGRYS